MYHYLWVKSVGFREAVPLIKYFEFIDAEASSRARASACHGRGIAGHCCRNIVVTLFLWPEAKEKRELYRFGS